MAIDVAAEVLGTQPRYVERIAEGDRNADAENIAGMTFVGAISGCLEQSTRPLSVFEQPSSS